MRVCEVTLEANLSELWTVMANASKKECIIAIQALADNRALEASSLHKSPIITPEIYKHLNSVQLGGLDLDNIVVGLSPFLMHVGYGAEAESAQEQVMAFMLVHSGGGAPNLSQVWELMASALAMAMTCITLVSTYKAIATLLDLVLASTHQVAVNFWQNSLLQIEHRMHILEEAFGGNLPQVLPCFLCHTQLCHPWDVTGMMQQCWVQLLHYTMSWTCFIGIIDMHQWPLLLPLPR